jgi:hypothetical protein
MSISKVSGLTLEANWKKHLEDSYAKCRGEHTSSWYSWAKTQFRSGNRTDTAVNALGHASTTTGIVTGAVLLPGASVVATAALGTAAAAASLYALPLVITAAAIAYWGYKKSEHNKVNKEIWDYWVSNVRDKPAVDVSTIAPATLTRWLGWYGDEGIANMNHMGAKNIEAKTTFDAKFKAIQTTRKVLDVKVKEINAKKTFVNDKERNEKAAKVKAANLDRDSLGLKYLELGKDLQYIIYRIERYLMYHQMLDLTIRGLLKQADLPAKKTAADTAFEQQVKSYQDLRDEVLTVPVAA